MRETEMQAFEELFTIAGLLENVAASDALSAHSQDLIALDRVLDQASRSHSGSWLGYHADVYYANLESPPPGAHFSQEWGLKDLSFSSLGSIGDWREFDSKQLEDHLLVLAGSPDFAVLNRESEEAVEIFREQKSHIRSIIINSIDRSADPFLQGLLEEIDNLNFASAFEFAQYRMPKGQFMSRDMIAIGQKNKIPPHELIRSRIDSVRHSFSVCKEAASIARKAASHLERKGKRLSQEARIGTNVFIGHGRSPAWRELKDFVQDRLHLQPDEFNRVPVAGVTNQARLGEMLDAAAVAFIVMTAEDENAEGQMVARMNVIHEVGLFQGRLGFTKAIVVLEDGCEEFSNIQGLGQIRFPAGRISACFEEVRQVLEREGVISG